MFDFDIVTVSGQIKMNGSKGSWGNCAQKLQIVLNKYKADKTSWVPMRKGSMHLAKGWNQL